MPDLDYIIKLVNDQKNSTAWQAQASLMDEALSIWNLEEYLSDEGKDVLQGLKHYTSNDPRTFADMVVAMLSKAKIISWIPLSDQKARERDVDAQKERFATGCLTAGDERLERLLLPSLQEIMSWQSAMRGRLAGRWVLTRSKDGGTYVDIMPWDSRDVYWGLGPKGLKWVCREVWKRLEDIEAEYEISLDSERDKVEAQGLLVYDWYDDKVNMVRTAEKVLKNATPHGSPHSLTRIPVVLTFVGAILPHSENNGNGKATLRGQDIYHSVRDIFKLENFLLSARATHAAWGVNPNWALTSKMGEKKLEENPLKGTGTSFGLAEGEKLEVIPPPEASRETAQLEGLVRMLAQKGTFTDVVSGMAPYPMAGVAIDRLLLPVNMVIVPCERAIASFYRQGIQLLCDQYATGAFDPFEVSGEDRQRKYFKETITPEVVAQGGKIDVKILSNLPRDDPKSWAMAAQARTPDANNMPLVTDRFILEHLIGVEDVDLEMSAVKAQVAARYSPWMMAVELMEAEVKQGEFFKADIYVAQVLIEIAKKMLEMQQLGVQPPRSLLEMKGEMEGIQTQRAQQPQSWPLNKGFPPTVLHGAEVENPPGYNPAVGPQVPAGTPRPGRQIPTGGPGIPIPLGLPSLEG